ncbi:hypothetical protein HRG_000650 [Hirsutella rhossiliensis]|uniref:Uncharacterized protein n=1 Tax=Hirsutella rhossiliensis TaxID=111463 RepID=A0A9P8N5H9_9HYPO|nr:uncharacterized protein HRG_00650 [Hirsutella rhossiliensis]KAH0968008.1 hypothetical protein HRG_00650 [Hirsutella rhossiliensis]
MREQIAALTARLNERSPSVESNRQHREPSTAFCRPKWPGLPTNRQSCLAYFCPFPEGKNPEYSDAAKSRIKVSDVLRKKDEFHSFILSIKNKFDEDVRTFRTENSRMVCLYNLLEGKARRALETRFSSDTRPFSGVAEMIQALESAYGNPNELSEALDRLQRLQFTVNGKTDIVDFLAEFDYLTATGRVPEDQMKHTLWQHIPANLDNSLLTKTRDESVTYEVFGFIKDAVHCQKRSMRQTQDSRSSDRSRRAPTKTAPTTAKTPNKTGSTPITSRDAGRALTDDEKRVHWDNGTCFICGKQGTSLASVPTAPMLSPVSPPSLSLPTTLIKIRETNRTITRLLDGP